MSISMCLLMSVLAAAQGNAAGSLVLTVQSAETGGVVPARIHITQPNEKPVQVEGYPFFRDHMTCNGTLRAELPAGTYKYLVARGPEYTQAEGDFKIKPGEELALSVTLKRLVNLPNEGWWAGDLHNHRPPEDMELLMRAEDLHVTPVITWWNNRNKTDTLDLSTPPLKHFDGCRYYDNLVGEDERGGGALLFFHTDKVLDIAWAEREYPCMVRFAEEVKKIPGAWVDIEKPFWWDVPVVLAHGIGDSIGVANNHMCRAKMYETEAWGRPRDEKRLPPPLGNGWWTQEIYYHILNSGIRIPPSAGSASGVLPNPLGYDRVYVHTGPVFTWESWWEGLQAGRCFVTNGPLLRVTVNGHFPGNIFKAPAPVELNVNARLDGNDHVPAFEIIKNGEVYRSIPVDITKETQGLGAVRFDESGWFLVRTITDRKDTFRFASTGPFYVEIGADTRRISKASAQFFLDWVRERKAQINLEHPDQQAEVMAYHDRAEAFWKARVLEANAE